MGFFKRVSSAEQKSNINFDENLDATHNVSNVFAKNDVNHLTQNTIAENTALKSSSEKQNPIINNDFENNWLAQNHPMRFIAKYLNTKTIENAIEKNPNIKELLKSEGLEVKYEIQNAKDIIMSHLIPTTNRAQNIYLKIGHTKKEPTYDYLTQAALLHDIGKIFIPREILNKKGKLNQKERYIIELHNKLSYEILITTDLNFQVAKLAFEHHNYDKKLKKSHENQALTIADIYSALRESRPYKKPISDIGAKAILYDMGTKGEIDTRFISYIN